MVTVRELNKDLISRANNASFNGTRGDANAYDYKRTVERILAWDISDEKKQKILDKLYEKWDKYLGYEAQHISVMVAGPAKYNAKKLDKSEQVLRAASEICNWLDDLERQISKGADDDGEIQRLVEMIEFCDTREELRPDADLARLAMKDNAKFIELFERLQPKYKWRKNSNLYKLYLASKEGKVKEIRRETFYEDANLTAYRKGDRAYIHFTMKPARQLIVALKSRKWWWNSGEEAWSTYLDRVDEEWVASISSRYGQYI